MSPEHAQTELYLQEAIMLNLLNTYCQHYSAALQQPGGLEPLVRQKLNPNTVTQQLVSMQSQQRQFWPTRAMPILFYSVSAVLRPQQLSHHAYTTTML